jgi:two-component system, LuxR family, sensor kinase FixL
MLGERFQRWLEVHKHRSIAVSCALAMAIAVVDRQVEGNVAIGVLYVFPIILWGLAQATGQTPQARLSTIAFGLTCAILREAYASYHWDEGFAMRIGFTSISYCSLGLLAREMSRNKILSMASLRREQQLLLSQWESDKQLRTLLQTSPLSILVTDADGTVLIANGAAREFLEATGELQGENIFQLLPDLKAALAPIRIGDSPLRLEIETAGARPSGEIFLAHVWFTAYKTSASLPDGGGQPGTRMAFVLWDASEDLRGRELAHSESIETTARGVMAAFAHEVKNLSSAAGALVNRISERPELEQDRDVLALAGVFGALSEFSSAGLQAGSSRSHALMDLSVILEQLRIIIQPLLEESGVTLDWTYSGRLPLVYADQGSLVQVFVNLASNSCRAMQDSPIRKISVEPTMEPNAVSIRFRDTGPGIMDPERLFRPFTSGAGGSGLGLYISRTVLRSFGGDLYYEPRAGGACFVLRLIRAHEDLRADTASAY